LVGSRERDSGRGLLVNHRLTRGSYRSCQRKLVLHLALGGHSSGEQKVGQALTEDVSKKWEATRDVCPMLMGHFSFVGSWGWARFKADDFFGWNLRHRTFSGSAAFCRRKATLSAQPNSLDGRLRPR